MPEEVLLHWELENIPDYLTEKNWRTNLVIYDVKKSLEWSDELTEDVAMRVLQRRSTDDIVKEMKEKYGISVLHGLAMIYTSYNAEGAGMSLNELFTGYTYKSSEIPYIRGGGFNVRIPNLNRKKPEFKTMTRAELDKFAKSVKDRRSKDDPRNTTVDKPKETPEPPNPSNSAMGTGEIGWSMAKGGGSIGGRRYSEHALERMAPNTPEVRAELTTRANQRATEQGLKPGTKEYNDFMNKQIDPRNIPPSVVEDTIKNGTKTPGNKQGTTVYQSDRVRVVTNANGDVITVIPR
ncbi:hypothetical protein EIM92_01560 [Paenibacillus lentus]|uniref:DUF4258 domain-containing protein n=1 Tax=Paenibacillus lentus TaxID=1338368 RepID=A0A3S8RQ26_9BACL|nr:hypothetical protein EIM92_01560 [Paenibacillus lentus]